MQTTVMIEPKYRLVADFVASLGARGKLVFTLDDAARSVGSSLNAADQALIRLQRKSIVMRLPRKLFVVVPPEYRGHGGPSPIWYIDQFMHHLGQPYYVGILSAAELYGSAHQRPQVFQVVTSKPRRRIDIPRKLPRTRIVFFQKSSIERTPTVQFKVHTGYFNVSSPEATAYDLVKYHRVAGGLNRAAEVISGLAERLDAAKLRELVDAGCEVASLQRLGYLLDYTGHGELTRLLHYDVRYKNPHVIPLQPRVVHKGTPRDAKWVLYVNAQIEVER